jgi:succinoglycan biosynthesis transport protein ExoP
MLSPNDPVEFEQSLTLHDYIDILNKRRLTILTVFLIVFIISLILSLSKETPVYTSLSTILLERNIGNNNAGLGTVYYWDPEFLPTQTEIIKSKQVALKVVENLELDTRYHSHFFGAEKIKLSIVSRIKKSIKKFFVSLFASEPAEKSSEGYSPETDPLYEKKFIADIIIGNIEVEPVEDTRVVDILYTDKDAQVAKLITDALVQAYIEENLEIKLSATQQSLRWMTSKAEQERNKLEEAERNLQRYMREHNLVTLENRLAVYPEKLRQFSMDLSSAETKRKEYEDLLEQITRFKGSPKALESLPVFTENRALQSLRDKILQADQVVKELSQKYGPKHPAMIKAMDDRDILVNEKYLEIQRIVDSAHKSYELASSNENNIRELLNSTKEELLDVNERFIQYSIMKREVESSRALYEALTSSLKQASVTEESQSVNIWVMREATFPILPSNQKPKRNILIGFILAVAAGIGVALLVEYLDNTIKSPDDVEKRFGLTTLGAILETKKGEKIESIVEEQHMSPVAENYRMIRSSLLLSSADRPPQTILVTSMKAQEGKTSTSLNLARTLAQVSSGKVLIIDADMRKPRMHSLLRVPNEVGLSTYLSGNIEEGITLPTSGGKIDVIPSGPIPPNPVELVGSQRMKKLLKTLTKTYDFIIVDSPPIIQLADGLILSTQVDGTILVTRAGKTTIDVFNAGLKKLNEFKPHILGVILNGMSTRISGSYSYYYYYQYYRKDKKDK